VKRVELGAKGIPYLVTHDGRTLRYPDPLIKVNDTVKIDLTTGKILDFIKFDVNNLCMITGGRNLGRVGIIERREKHEGSFEIIHVRDAAGHKFATRLANVFVIGTQTPEGPHAWILMPRRKVQKLSQGVKLSILEEQQHNLKRQKETKKKG